MRRALIVFLLLFAGNAAASQCVERAVLRDMEYFASKYKWSNGRVDIKVWESPAMIKMVGTVNPGAHVQVKDRAGGFVKIKAEEVQGGATGWVSEGQLEMTFVQSGEDSAGGCGYTALYHDSTALKPDTAPQKKEEKLTLPPPNEGKASRKAPLKPILKPASGPR